MFDRTDALEALVSVYPSVLETLPGEFDSHDFFLKLAHQHQQLYVKALVTFADMEYPFMAVHGEIARRLSESGLVKKSGVRNSQDIFKQVNSATVWQKGWSMWLVYLRFDDNGQVKTYHVTAENKRRVDSIFAMAEQHGLTKSEKLVEYAFFYARATTHPKHVPNFHFYKWPEFEEKWHDVDG